MKTNQKGFAHVGLVILAVVLAIGTAGGYVVYSRNQVSNPEPVAETAQPATKSDTVASTPKKTTETTTQSSDDSLATYSDPVWQYSFSYPKTWSVETKDGDTTIKSPDYKEHDYGIGGTIEKGSKIFISMQIREPFYNTVSDLPFTDISQDVTATNVNFLKVAGYDAVQGDSGFEGQYWTRTIFPYRNKSQIMISYNYGDNQKSANLTIYSNLLDTFKIIP